MLDRRMRNPFADTPDAPLASTVGFALRCLGFRVGFPFTLGPEDRDRELRKVREATCTHCGGAGLQPWPHRRTDGLYLLLATCDRCHGVTTV
jgi:hypothetical protein